MTDTTATERLNFIQELRLQRWDDHRYYHHSRINQSLHLLSALCFLTCYAVVAFDPVLAALLGWFGAMVSRQVGHFFFEPKGYDHVNHATHEHKEAIKVGYNLRRKVVLLSIWAAIPVLLWAEPSFFGLFTPYVDFSGFLHHLSVLWLTVAALAVTARTAWLCITRDLQTGLVWAAKILTDPFHDVLLYWRAPLQVLRGELLDPMLDWPTPSRRA